jgi:hypothetical protein
MQCADISDLLDIEPVSPNIQWQLTIIAMLDLAIVRKAQEFQESRVWYLFMDFLLTKKHGYQLSRFGSFELYLLLDYSFL